MSSLLVETAVSSLEFSRRMTLMFLDEIGEKDFLHQPVPKGNHAMWICGHIVYVDDSILTVVSGQESNLSDSWQNLFGLGSEPQGDPDCYCSREEMMENLASVRGDLISWFKGASDEKLLAPVEGDKFPVSANVLGLASFAACHEAMHAGQLTVIRRSLGLAPKIT